MILYGVGVGGAQAGASEGDGVDMVEVVVGCKSHPVDCMHVVV